MNTTYTKKAQMKKRRWSEEEVEYLKENWGKYSVYNISKKVNKTIESVCSKANRLGLGRQVEYQGYITFTMLAELLKIDKATFYKYAKKYNLKYTAKKMPHSRIRITTTDNFFDWAKEHQDIIDVCNIPLNHLGVEPDWVSDLRQYRIDHPKDGLRLKQKEWTSLELSKLDIYIRTGKYTLTELATMLNRSESSVSNKISNLGLAHYIKLEERKVWTEDEAAILMDYTNTLRHGDKPDWKLISTKLGRSENACRTKYRYINKCQNNDNRKYWTDEESKQLFLLIERDIKNNEEIKWDTISLKLNRSIHSCKAKYQRAK